VGELAAGDAAQHHVDVAVADLVVDQVGRPLVVERDAGHRDVDAPHLAALVRLGAQVAHVFAGELAALAHLQAQDQLGVHARHEGDLEGPDPVHLVRLHHHGPVGQPVQAQQVTGRGAAVHGGPVTPGDLGGVEGVVEVGVTHQHGIGPRHPPVHQRPVGQHGAASHHVAQRGPAHVGVDQHGGALVAEHEPGHAQPPHLETRGQPEIGGAHGQVGDRGPVPLLVAAAGGRVAEQVDGVAQRGGHGRGPDVGRGVHRG
jgi:hypothetical protein